MLVQRELLSKAGYLWGPSTQSLAPAPCQQICCRESLEVADKGPACLGILLSAPLGSRAHITSLVVTEERKASRSGPSLACL